jgi:nucleotide-binding universal stress UspA family protein
VDVLAFANRFAATPDITMILLHVINLNIIAPESRVYDELGWEAACYLERIANQFINPMTSTITHVRTGDIANEILAEAKAEKVDLIILPTCSPSIWTRLVAVWKPRCGSSISNLAKKVVREATCNVMLVMARTTLDCAKVWRRGSMKRNTSLTTKEALMPLSLTPRL